VPPVHTALTPLVGRQQMYSAPKISRTSKSLKYFRERPSGTWPDLEGSSGQLQK